MLSIFEQKEFERQPEKKLTLNRLQNVLGAPPPAAGEPPSVAAVVEPPAPMTVSPGPAPFERKPAGPPEPLARATPPVAEPVTPSIPPELQEFAEQFTRGFREVLVSTVRDIQAPMAEDHRKMETAFDLHARTAREVEALRSDLNGAYERIDSLTKMLQELSAKAGKIEDAVNISTAAAHAIQDAQQALEKRLELQAGVIRSLHAGMQSREERLDKVLAAFQALQGVSGERGPRRPLPEEL
jgi:ABC-type transporter Mla subunit MlaD